MARNTGKESIMTLGTAVFRRIVEEAKEKGANLVRGPAIRAIADTMEETQRFGSHAREYLEECARMRLDACAKGERF
jgi:hypothetical protein